MFESKVLKYEYDYLAPDKSEIRLLLGNRGGNMWHCRLPRGRTSSPVCHKSVDEIWFFTSGNGRVWRSEGNVEKILEAKKGTCITIPAGTKFQFENNGGEDLEFVGVTMPPWPGPQEAYNVEGPWKT
jgi:mannose-6-phosphate isomerase-like protein (cupin superfamily)